MGRGQKRGRTQRKHFKDSRENIWKYNNDGKRNGDEDGAKLDHSNPSWQPFTTENSAFEEYYKEQGIVPEEEWNEFISFLRKPLPAAFRINSSGQFYNDIRLQLENDFVKSLEADLGNKYETEAIRPLPWYPGNLAWHLNFSRMQLRKNQALERFHEFLKLENENGNITRQEAVSMVPPLFLEILPDHHVLDMCAAPGSKTFQLLEMMHQSTGLGSLPNGLVIANDVDVQRCNLLIHQTKRMCSANLIVTNHEAQHFPSCRLANTSLELCNMEHENGGLTSSSSSRQVEEASNNQLLFDRVLCDVPCSGDGTLRKAPDIWRKWNSGMGNGLHRLQVHIAMRGLTLLKVGGRMVYSTCSMNPVENEAVIAEVLRRCGNSVELLDVSSELPQLIRRPGLKKWKVRDRGLWLDSYANVPLARKGAIVPSMFLLGQRSEPNKVLPNDVILDPKMQDDTVDKEIDSIRCHNISSTNHSSKCDILENATILADHGSKTKSEMAETPPDTVMVDLNCDYTDDVSFPLERCLRIVPHDQNSGAFFIAVLKKLAPLLDVSGNNPRQYKGSAKSKYEVPKDKNDILEDELKSEKGSSEHASVNNHQILTQVSDGNLQVKHNIPMEDDLRVDSIDTPQKGTDLEKGSTCFTENCAHERAKAAKGRLQIQGKWRGVDPVLFFRDEEVIKSLRTFYGIAESFPLEGHLVTRNSDSNHVKRIYYISKSVHNILELNFKVGEPLKITSLGLKIFERQTSKDAYASTPCSFRISSEGIPLLLPYISKQILSASLTDFHNLLKYRNIKFSEFVDADFGQKASNLLLGCCVIVLNKGNHPPDNIIIDASTIAIGCWKGKTNLSVMVSEVDSLELLARISVRFGTGEGSLRGEPKCMGGSLEDGITGGPNDVEYREDSEVDVGSNDAECNEDFEAAEKGT
uniref:tRNA (Cytosine(34)-C(5))-methyltransferase n=2 Tax=Anthurium amnicola TaxID=1678845 RepID=A0A1D1ZIH6_9ARAE